MYCRYNHAFFAAEDSCRGAHQSRRSCWENQGVVDGLPKVRDTDHSRMMLMFQIAGELEGRLRPCGVDRDARGCRVCRLVPNLSKRVIKLTSQKGLHSGLFRRDQFGVERARSGVYPSNHHPRVAFRRLRVWETFRSIRAYARPTRSRLHPKMDLPGRFLADCQLRCRLDPGRNEEFDGCG